MKLFIKIILVLYRHFFFIISTIVDILKPFLGHRLSYFEKVSFCFLRCSPRCLFGTVLKKNIFFIFLYIFYFFKKVDHFLFSSGLIFPVLTLKFPVFFHLLSNICVFVQLKVFHHDLTLALKPVLVRCCSIHLKSNPNTMSPLKLFITQRFVSHT